MYLEFYGLKEKPFSLTPDPTFLYYSEAHKRAVAFLKYGLQESKGFLQLTGPVGSGKTTLLRAILGELDESTRTAYIINPSAPFPDLLRSIMKDLEIPNIPQTRIKIELLDFFHNYLLLQMRRHNSVIVIFDEAQNISLKNLEEIRMLSNFETTKGKLIQIVFVGQPELIQTLDRPDLRQLKQRIQVRYNLSPLNPLEVKEYIDHRLKIAGSDGSIQFRDDACRAIYDFSGGIPRLINSVCDVALLIGYVGERKSFGADVIEEATGELNGTFNAESADGSELDEPLLFESDEDTDSEPDPIAVAPDMLEVPEVRELDTAVSAGAETGGEPPILSQEKTQPAIQAKGSDQDAEPPALGEKQTTSITAIGPEMSAGVEESVHSPAEHTDLEDGKEEQSAKELNDSPGGEPLGGIESAGPPIFVNERASEREADSSAIAPEELVASDEIDSKEGLDAAPFLHAESEIEPPVALDDTEERDRQAENVDRDAEALSLSEKQATAVTLIEPDLDEVTPEALEKATELANLDDGKNGTASKAGIAEEDTILDPSDVAPTLCIPEASEAARPPAEIPKSHTDLLHSYLRHSKTGRFHVPGSSVTSFGASEKSLGMRLRGIIGKNSKKDNGDVADAADGSEALPAERGKSGPPDRERRQRGHRHRKTKLFSSRKPDNIKVAALMAGGNVILGNTSQISVGKIGFYLSPPDVRNGKIQQFIPFKQALALRFLGDFQEGWKKNCSPTIHAPSGRQIVATLLNGEVVEGSTPKKFDPECLRFFVLSTGPEGEPLWTLVERAGTIGIRTEDFVEGIYSDQPLSLLELVETFIFGDEKICDHESSGDAHFKSGDLDEALQEYRLALDNGADAGRLEFKIALSHFNLGTWYLKENRFQEAKAEFLRVNVDSRLLKKARAKAIMIERVDGTLEDTSAVEKER